MSNLPPLPKKYILSICENKERLVNSTLGIRCYAIGKYKNLQPSNYGGFCKSLHNCLHILYLLYDLEHTKLYLMISDVERIAKRMRTWSALTLVFCPVSQSPSKTAHTEVAQSKKSVKIRPAKHRMGLIQMQQIFNLAGDGLHDLTVFLILCLRFCNYGNYFPIVTFGKGNKHNMPVSVSLQGDFTAAAQAVVVFAPQHQLG